MTSIQGSNVHEAFALMATLLAPRVSMRYLNLCKKLLQRRQMEEVFEERAAAKRCAFPGCAQLLATTTGKFRVSLARHEIYEARYERQFCSQICHKRARVLLATLNQKPPQLVPSIVEVFGTDQPNPLDYEDEDGDNNIKTKASADAGDAGVEKSEPMPKVRLAWAKTQDLGVVERRHSTARPMSAGVRGGYGHAPSALSALKGGVSSTLKENEAPTQVDRSFPTREQATLIEGYVFPAHKQKLAKKVEKIVKKSQEEGDDDDDIVVSDSDESDLAASDVSSAGSFEISDFDDEEVVTLNDLPLFSHLWGLLSSWITHDTTLFVAGKPMLAKKWDNDELEFLPEGLDKAEVDAARRRARQIRSERWNSLSLMLRRPLPQVALKLKLDSDRFANHRIDRITETFALRDAIDTRNAHQWICIATILMLVVYDVKLDELLDGERSEQVKSLTNLDASELCQLLQLFYDVRKDSDVAVDTDVAPVAEVEVIDENAAKGEEEAKDQTFCRKCRRAKNKCVCAIRAKAPIDESSIPLEEMLQEALVLRDELLRPDD
ncbi:unnamed protein product [Hyaloperonospora brassicae]|uniref:RNA polymerase II subunit B1 CTD phosphatase RPAP2 homolog n=1 Tax=Hyaloperonospora brassicae TaxID=162125 RepID=A0AAV0TTM4_HYABA|nr:unnamed protein product [Hyaloperonospora brassicae]